MFFATGFLCNFVTYVTSCPFHVSHVSANSRLTRVKQHIYLHNVPTNIVQIMRTAFTFSFHLSRVRKFTTNLFAHEEISLIPCPFLYAWRPLQNKYFLSILSKRFCRDETIHAVIA